MMGDMRQALRELSPSHISLLRCLSLPHVSALTPLPRREPVQVALIEHGIRPHGGLDRRVLAVAPHEDVGGAVDVEVGDQRLFHV